MYVFLCECFGTLQVFPMGLYWFVFFPSGRVLGLPAAPHQCSWEPGALNLLPGESAALPPWASLPVSLMMNGVKHLVKDTIFLKCLFKPFVYFSGFLLFLFVMNWQGFALFAFEFCILGASSMKYACFEFLHSAACPPSHGVCSGRASVISHPHTYLLRHYRLKPALPPQCYSGVSLAPWGKLSKIKRTGLYSGF